MQRDLHVCFRHHFCGTISPQTALTCKYFPSSRLSSQVSLYTYFILLHSSNQSIMIFKDEFAIYHLILVWMCMCKYVCIYRIAWEFTHFEGSNPSVGHILSSSNCFTNIENYSASLVVIKCPLPDLSSYFTFLLPATFCLFWVHVFFKWQSFAAILWNT